jgi:hypothetical protein
MNRRGFVAEGRDTALGIRFAIQAQGSTTRQQGGDDEAMGAGDEVGLVILTKRPQRDDGMENRPTGRGEQ